MNWPLNGSCRNTNGAFGGPLPFKNATTEEVVNHMRARLFGLPDGNFVPLGSSTMPESQMLAIAEQSENHPICV
jgi:hypothetical protein